jgi:hypothetical protein
VQAEGETLKYVSASHKFQAFSLNISMAENFCDNCTLTQNLAAVSSPL